MTLNGKVCVVPCKATRRSELETANSTIQASAILNRCIKKTPNGAVHLKVLKQDTECIFLENHESLALSFETDQGLSPSNRFQGGFADYLSQAPLGYLFMQYLRDL